MRILLNKIFLLFLPILLIFPILAESAVFYGKEYRNSLGKGSSLFQVNSADKKYRFKVYEHRIEVWSRSRKKVFFIKALKTEFSVENIAYHKKRVLIFFKQASPVSWNILSDRVKPLSFRENQSKKLKQQSQKLKKDPRNYRLALEKTQLLQDYSGVLFLKYSNKPDLYIYFSPKSPSKLEKTNYQNKNNRLIYKKNLLNLAPVLRQNEQIKNIWKQGIKTQNGFITFQPSLKDWVKALKKLKDNLPNDLKSLELLNSFFPESDTIQLALAEKQIESKSYSAALKHLKKLRKTSTLRNTVRLKTGKIYFLQRKYNRAKRNLRRVKNAESYYYLGTIYLIQRKYKSARWYLNQSLKLNPTYSKAYNNLSVVYQKQRRFSRAEKILLDGISKNPKNPKLYYNLGLLQEKLKKEGLALLAYEKAYSLENTHTGTINRLYYLYMKWNMLSDALALLKRTLQSRPEDSVSHYNIALLYLQQKQRALAVFHFNAFLSFSKDSTLKKRVAYRLKQILKKF